MKSADLLLDKTGCGRRREIPVDPQPFCLALLRVKLGREQLSAPDRRHERGAVVALGEDEAAVRGDAVVAVDEIERLALVGEPLAEAGLRAA